MKNNRDLSWVKRVLIIKMRYIGDTVLVTPLLHSLRQNMPRAELHFLVNRQTAAVMKGHPDIDQILPYDYDRAKKDYAYFLKFLFKLRRLKYGLVLDLTKNDRSALFTFISGAGVRMGYQNSSLFAQLAYSRQIPYRMGRIHTVDHHLDMAGALGLSIDDIHPSLTVSAPDLAWIHQLLEKLGVSTEKPFVLIHPGARRWYKSWPMERFAGIADALATRYGVQVVLSGSDADQKACLDIRSLVKTRVFDLCGQVPLEQLPALIKSSAMLLGNDSAPIHIATAVDTPVIALFGPTRWEDWQPRRDHDKTIGMNCRCRPCGHSRPDCPHGRNYCMSHISEKKVWAYIEEIFASRAPGILSHTQ